MSRFVRILKENDLFLNIHRSKISEVIEMDEKLCKIICSTGHEYMIDMAIEDLMAEIEEEDD
jgi:hypothetical protein